MIITNNIEYFNNIGFVNNNLQNNYNITNTNLLTFFSQYLKNKTIYNFVKLKNLICKNCLFFASFFVYFTSVKILTFLNNNFYYCFVNETLTHVANCANFLMAFSNFSDILKIIKNNITQTQITTLYLKLLLTFICVKL